MPAAEPMTQEIINRLKDLLPQCNGVSGGPWNVSGYQVRVNFTDKRPGCEVFHLVKTLAFDTLTTLTPSGVERIRAAVFTNVREQVEEASHDGIGFWRSCSGCYEGEDGQNTNGFPYSDDFGCVLGGGCQECGGIGAIWDTTDYAAMAADMLAEDRALALPSEPPSQGDVEGRARELVEKLDARIADQRERGGDMMTYGTPHPLDVELRDFLQALASKKDGRS